VWHLAGAGWAAHAVKLRLVLSQCMPVLHRHAALIIAKEFWIFFGPWVRNIR
jgi:hypothetical protein